MKDDIDFIAFNIVIDDVKFADGRTEQGILGGGGPQSAFGMRLWSESVGLVGSVGTDFPEELWEILRQMEINLDGVKYESFPTLRALQQFDWTQERAQEWSTSEESLSAHLHHDLTYLPDHYQRASGFHVGIHPLHPELSFLDSLCRLGGLMSIETHKGAERPLSKRELNIILEMTDLFSLNYREAVSLLSEEDIGKQIRMLLACGAKRIALRLGADGIILADNYQQIIIPAYSIPVCSYLGAGNAFCGGFLVGWEKSSDLVEAGLCGVISASFMMEQVGVPKLNDQTMKQAKQRLECHRHRVVFR